MRNHFLIGSVAMAIAGPVAAEPWERGFVLENYEPAFYYGGKAPAPGSTDTSRPGADCPKGTIPDHDYRKMLTTKWRTEAEIAPLLLKPADDPDPVDTHFALEAAITYRGFRRDIEVYINPFGAPDPGMQQVTGKIAEGFNLDGDTKTGGFVSPTGERGVDNEYYRAAGCTMSYRDPDYTAYLSRRGNDKMLEGLYTFVVRMTGAKDPMNDDDVTVEVGYSPDPVVKNPNGGAVADYSFRIAKTAQYTRLKAKIKNGVVETEQVEELRVPHFAWFPANAGEALFKKGKMRFVVDKDGAMSGLLGGYRDWREYYAIDAFNQGQREPHSATTREVFYHQNQVGLYYALKRNADGIPDPKTGQNTAISMAYRFKGKPAYVIDPETPVSVVTTEQARRELAAAYRAQFLTAISTLAIQPNLGADRRRPRMGEKPATVADASAPAVSAPRTAQPTP